MAKITDFETFRNGTLDFTVSGTSIDGRYSVLGPDGVQDPLLRNGVAFSFGAPEEIEVLGLLREWFCENLTPEIEAVLNELDEMPEWRNLPDRFSGAVLFHRIRWVIERLENRKGQSVFSKGRRLIEFIDRSGKVVASARVELKGCRIGGTIHLENAPAEFRALFEEFEEIVNGQMFSFLDEIEGKIAALSLRVSFENGDEIFVKDLQVFPSTGDVSFKLAEVSAPSARPA